MTGYARSANTVFAFLMSAALGLLPSCLPPDSAGSSVTELNTGCDGTCDCSAYRGCVEGGDIWCEFSRCRTNGRVGDLTCVDRVDRFCTPSMPPPIADAGVRTALPYPARICTWSMFRPATALYEFGWIDVIADTEGSTFELMRANVLGVRVDGTIVPIQGSALGQDPFTSFANYNRAPWFGGSDYHEPASSPTRTADAWVFTVPTNRVLHIILGGERVDAYREAYMMVQARTTGTARYSVGLDYDSNLTVDDGGRELRPYAGFSNWGNSSFPGMDLTLSNPISTEPNFCGYRPIMTSPMPPPATSREFVFEPGSVFRTADSSSSFYCSSGWVTTIWGPTEAQNLVSSPGGTIRSSAPYSWPSFGALTMYCDARRDWVDWRPWRGRPVSEISGFGTLTMCGTDIRSLAVIGTEAYPKPVINWGAARASCP